MKQTIVMICVIGVLVVGFVIARIVISGSAETQSSAVASKADERASAESRSDLSRSPKSPASPLSDFDPEDIPFDFLDEAWILPEDSTPAFDDRDLETWADEVIPLVEQATGRSFLRRPRMRVASRAELAESLARDISLEIRTTLRQVDRSEVEVLARAQAAMMAPALLGKYGAIDETLYMAESNLRTICDLAQIDDAQIVPMAKVVLSHELTHALQDQHADLDAVMRRLPSHVAAETFAKIIEGQAVLVQDRVGAQLELDEASLEVSRLFAAGALGAFDPRLERLLRPAALQMESIYLGGRDLLARVEAELGRDAIWALVENPPESLIEIERTVRASSPLFSPQNDPALLADLESFFGSAQWRPANIRIADNGFMRLFEYADRETRMRLLAWTDFARRLDLDDPESHRQCSVVFLRLKRASDLDAFIGTIRRDSDAMYAAREWAGSFDPATVTTKPMEDVHADYAVGSSFPARTTDGEPSTHSIMMIARDDMVLFIRGTYVDLDTERMVELAEEIFARWEARRPASNAE
jgi:hypothetical protein